MEGEKTNQPPQAAVAQTKQPPSVLSGQMKQPTAGVLGQHDHESPRHLGIVLGVLVVVLVAASGGLYLWWSGVFSDTADEPEAGEASVALPPEAGDSGFNPPAPDLSELSSSDEVNAILLDLEKIDIDSIDDEMRLITLDINKLTEPGSEPAPPATP